MCPGYGAPTNVKAWKNADVLEWASSFSFSEDNRTTIIEFLRGGITGMLLLTLSTAELVGLKQLSFGAAKELVFAIDAMKAERGTRNFLDVPCGGGSRDLFRISIHKVFLSTILIRHACI